eukprot:IDg12992t1
MCSILQHLVSSAPYYRGYMLLNKRPRCEIATSSGADDNAPDRWRLFRCSPGNARDICPLNVSDYDFYGSTHDSFRSFIGEFEPGLHVKHPEQISRRIFMRQCTVSASTSTVHREYLCVVKNPTRTGVLNNSTEDLYALLYDV